MYQNIAIGKSLNLLKLLCSINFNAAILFLFYVSVISLQGDALFFADDSELYGPMMGNFRLMLLYLCITEIAVYGFCRMRGNYQAILLLGLFFLVLMVSIDFYGFINQVPVDDNYRCLFMYLGLSHLLYGSLRLKTGKQTL